MIHYADLKLDSIQNTFTPTGRLQRPKASSGEPVRYEIPQKRVTNPSCTYFETRDTIAAETWARMMSHYFACSFGGPALPGQQFRQEGGSEDQQRRRSVLRRTVAAVGEAGLAELGFDVGRRLAVRARVRWRIDVLEGAGARHHHTIVDDLLHLLAHGSRLLVLLVEGVRGLRWMVAFDVAPLSLLVVDDFLRERIVAEGGRRGVGRASPASEGVGWLEVDHQQRR